MKHHVTNMILWVIKALLKIVPIRNNQIVFYSAFDFGDNARGIYEYLKKSKLVCNYNVVWLVSDSKKYAHLSEPAVFYSHKSLYGLWAFLRSKYIVRTHSLFGNQYNSKKQILVNAFHGMPIKSFITSDRANEDFDNFSFLPTTSEVFSKIISKSFAMDIARFPILGMARNDFLFEQTDVLHDMGLDGFDKVLLWMPTFRTSSIGQFNDGKQSEIGIPCVKRQELDVLNKKLADKNIVLLLKLHPWACDSVGDLSRYSNIFNVNNDDIPYPYTLYHFVAQADVLLTDFSSIYVDFLLTNKPIAFVMDDYEEYRDSRGFAFDHIEDYLAGEIIFDFGGLLQYIENMDQVNSTYEEKRKEICHFFHYYNDNLSAARTIDYMNKQTKEVN